MAVQQRAQSGENPGLPAGQCPVAVSAKDFKAAEVWRLRCRWWVQNPLTVEAATRPADIALLANHFAKKYAEANGMRAAYVRVQIARPAEEGKVWVYRLVAFATVDKGFVIIEPGSHKVVKVEVGERFRELNGFSALPYDDTITEVTIIW